MMIDNKSIIIYNVYNVQKKWYRYVIRYIFGWRYVEKKIKLNVFLMSENNSNILAPILGQYGIKPSDFIAKLKDTFMSTFSLNNLGKVNIDILLNNLVFSFILYIGKNNVYRFVFKKFNNSFLYNTFFQRKKGIYIQVLFLYKLQCLKGMRKSLFFLLKKLLKLRLLLLLFYLLFLILFDFDFLAWKDIIYTSVVYSYNLSNDYGVLSFKDYDSCFGFRDFLSLSRVFVEVWKYVPLYEYYKYDDIAFVSDTFDYEAWAKRKKIFYNGFYYEWKDYMSVILNPYKAEYLYFEGEVLDDTSAFAFFYNAYSSWILTEAPFFTDDFFAKEEVWMKGYKGEAFVCLNLFNELDNIFYHLDNHFNFLNGDYVYSAALGEEEERMSIVKNAIGKVYGFEGEYRGEDAIFERVFNNNNNMKVNLEEVSVVQNAIYAMRSV